MTKKVAQIKTLDKTLNSKYQQYFETDDMVVGQPTDDPKVL